jgi:hypothetical protein
MGEEEEAKPWESGRLEHGGEVEHAPETGKAREVDVRAGLWFLSWRTCMGQRGQGPARTTGIGERGRTKRRERKHGNVAGVVCRTVRYYKKDVFS